MSNTNIPASPANTAPTPPTPVNNQNTPYVWGQITAGPAAIAFTAVMQLASLLTKAMEMYNQQAQLQFSIQMTAAKCGANATQAAARDQAVGTFCEAANSLASAGFSAAGLGYQSMSYNKPALEEAQENQAGLNKLQTSLAKARTESTNGSVGTMPENTNEAVQRRIEELNSDAGTVTAASKKTDFVNDDESQGTITDAALKHMAQNGQLESFTETLTTAQENNSRAINDWHSNLQSVNTKIDLYKGMATGGTGAISGAVSGAYQIQGGIDNSNATMLNSFAQQAGQMASTSQGTISKLYDEELQAYQMLQQMAASARAPV